MYLELPSGAKIEVQEKITSLELVDMLTHPFYESLRLEKEKNEALELSLPPEELKQNPQYTAGRRKISSLEYTIQAINRWGIEKHNQHDVLDKVMRIEERKRIKGIVIDESRLTPEEKSWVKSGLDPECVRMLQDNFLARPKQALILSNPLPDIPQEVKKCTCNTAGVSIPAARRHCRKILSAFSSYTTNRPNCKICSAMRRRS